MKKILLSLLAVMISFTALAQLTVSRLPSTILKENKQNGI